MPLVIFVSFPMNKQLAILLAIVFIDLLGFGIVIPLLPPLVKDMGEGPFMVGLIIGVFSFFQFLFSPILGRLSDKYGRKPVLLISTAINALGYFILFFSHSIWMLILARTLSGIGTANLPVVQAYIADTSEKHERTKRMSLIASMFGLGFIFGPFVGGFTASNYDINTPFIITAVFSTINALFILLLLPESNKSLKKHIKIELINIKVMREVMNPPNIRFLIVLFFLASFSLALIIGVLPLFTAERFGWGEAENGYFFMAIGIAQFIVQAFGIRFLLKYFREARLVKFGLIIFCLSNLGIGIALNEPILLISGAISAVGFGLMNSNIQSLISLESNPEEQGAVLGVAQSLSALARVIGPIVGGALASWHLNFPYFASAIFIILILVWGWKKLAHAESITFEKKK